MAKPTVTLVSPAAVIIGRTYTFQFDVTVEKSTKIEGIVARLRGKQEWRRSMGLQGASDTPTSGHAPIPDTRVHVAGPRVLPAGRHRYNVPLEIPADTAPTHSFEHAYGWLEITLKIEMAWWRPNHVSTFELRARRPPATALVREPAISRSTGEPNERRLDLAIASRVLVAGETITGSVAAFHIETRQAREVVVQIEPAITHPLGGDGGGVIAQTRLEIPGDAGGTSIPFKLTVPRNTVPSFTCPTHTLGWRLVAYMRGGKGEVRIPLEIVDPEAAAIAPPIGAIPRLGDDRVFAVFATFAERAGWRDLGEASPAVQLVAGESTHRLAYEYRDEAGTHLVATIRHPSLGLGLSVSPGSRTRHVFLRDVEIDDPAWDRAHHVKATSPAQTIPMLKASASALTRATGALGMLVEWTDNAIAYELAITNIEDKDLAIAAAALAELDRALANSRASIAPPIDVDLVAYRDLGKLLDAPIVVGDLSIDGMLGTIPIAVRSIWNGERVTGMRASAGDPDRTAELARAIRVALPTADSPRIDLADALRDRVAAWPAGMIELTIGDGVASVTLPVAGALDVARVRELVEWTSSLVAALDPKAGPYR